MSLYGPPYCSKCGGALSTAGMCYNSTCRAYGLEIGEPGPQTVAQVLINAGYRAPLPTLEELVPRYLEAMLRVGRVWSDDGTRGMVDQAMELARETIRRLAEAQKP